MLLGMQELRCRALGGWRVPSAGKHPRLAENRSKSTPALLLFFFPHLIITQHIRADGCGRAVDPWAAFPSPQPSPGRALVPLRGHRRKRHQREGEFSFAKGWFIAGSEIPAMYFRAQTRRTPASPAAEPHGMEFL